MRTTVASLGVLSSVLAGGSLAFAACYDFEDAEQHIPNCTPGLTCGYGCFNNWTVVAGNYCEIPISTGPVLALCTYGYVMLDPVEGCVCLPDGAEPIEFSFSVGAPACVKLCTDVTPGPVGD